MGLKPRIGLLGGSFDPVHRAHIRLAHCALQALGLDTVELLPASQPWQRHPLGASAAHRLRMLEIACAGEPGLLVNPIELERPGATYTIDTLERLPRNVAYTWILGADQLTNFCTWHRWRDILAHVQLAVAERPGADGTPPPELAEALARGHSRLLRIPFEPEAISASAIRRALWSGASVDDMLDPAVLAYIRAHGLYRSSPPDKDRDHAP